VRELIEKARAVLVAEAKTMQAMKEGHRDRSFIDAPQARCNNRARRMPITLREPASRSPVGSRLT
jgi:hypothetical protein